MYTSKSDTARLVCEHIGWRFDTSPIEAFRRGQVIYATGTLLKPDEWRALAGHDGDSIGDCILRITRVPHTIR